MGHQKLAPFPFLNIENKFSKEVLLYIVVGKNAEIVTYNIKKFVKFSIQNLAMELGVCERTIRRDIEELTLTYPIETVRGRYGGGVRMADWYFQDRPKLTPKQTALLKRLAIGLHGEDLDEMNRILTHFAS